MPSSHQTCEDYRQASGYRNAKRTERRNAPGDVTGAAVMVGRTVADVDFDADYAMLNRIALAAGYGEC